MSPADVQAQFRDVYSRMISTGLSIKQFFPSEKLLSSGWRSIGDLHTTAIALKDVAYQLVYEELDRHDAYHIKMPDGGLLLFQYTFTQSDQLAKHRLAYFPCSILPTVDEAPHLYENDELYGDILLNRL